MYWARGWTIFWVRAGLLVTLLLLLGAVQSRAFRLSARAASELGWETNDARAMGALIALSAIGGGLVMYRTWPGRYSALWLAGSVPILAWVSLAFVLISPRRGAYEQILGYVRDARTAALVFELSRAGKLTLITVGLMWRAGRSLWPKTHRFRDRVGALRESSTLPLGSEPVA